MLVQHFFLLCPGCWIFQTDKPKAFGFCPSAQAPGTSLVLNRIPAVKRAHDSADSVKEQQIPSLWLTSLETVPCFHPIIPSTWKTPWPLPFSCFFHGFLNSPLSVFHYPPVTTICLSLPPCLQAYHPSFLFPFPSPHPLPAACTLVWKPWQYLELFSIPPPWLLRSLSVLLRSQMAFFS